MPPLAFWFASPIAMYGIVERTEPVSTQRAKFGLRVARTATLTGLLAPEPAGLAPAAGAGAASLASAAGFAASAGFAAVAGAVVAAAAGALAAGVAGLAASAGFVSAGFAG